MSDDGAEIRYGNTSELGLPMFLTSVEAGYDPLEPDEMFFFIGFTSIIGTQHSIHVKVGQLDILLDFIKERANSALEVVANLDKYQDEELREMLDNG